MKTFLLLVLQLLIAGRLTAEQGPPPPLDVMVKQADAVAVITITNLISRDFTIRSNQVLQQKADIIVERVIKGTITQPAQLRFYAVNYHQISCRPPPLNNGRYIAFLNRDGTFYSRTDDWGSLGWIQDGDVCWENRWWSLPALISEIEKQLTKP